MDCALRLRVDSLSEVRENGIRNDVMGLVTVIIIFESLVEIVSTGTSKQSSLFTSFIRIYFMPSLSHIAQNERDLNGNIKQKMGFCDLHADGTEISLDLGVYHSNNADSLLLRSGNHDA